MRLYCYKAHGPYPSLIVLLRHVKRVHGVRPVPVSDKEE